MRHPRSLSAVARVSLLATITIALSASNLLAQDIVPPELHAPTLVDENVVGEPVAAGPMSIEECVQLGLQNQPALAAARASLEAAMESQAGLHSLPRIASLLRREIPIRKQQAMLGITIADAGLKQAGWETRYAITRNYLSAIYARQQQAVVESVVEKLQSSLKRAKLLVKAGDPNIKVTQIDADKLEINLQFYKAKLVEAKVGFEKALAALREAIGVDCNFRLVIDDSLNLPPLAEDLQRQALVALALQHRGEMVQANLVHQVVGLEIAAQGATRRNTLQLNTFAAGSDVHARPIPQGISNLQYRPGAIGVEMPTLLVGKRCQRVARAAAFHRRSAQVVRKTKNLITLETEANFLKWKEAAQKVEALQDTPEQAAKVADLVQRRFDIGNVSGEELIRARTLEDQAKAEYNEALYIHALALAALERVTAGGYRPNYHATNESADENGENGENGLNNDLP